MNVPQRIIEKRFLVNLDTSIVHDIENEKRNCQIDELLDGDNAWGFDTLKEAYEDGFVPCKWCLEHGARLNFYLGLS